MVQNQEAKGYEKKERKKKKKKLQGMGLTQERLAFKEQYLAILVKLNCV